MEVGGFAMGAIALVSLAKDCTELYAMFVSAQELEKDSSSLVTKLDIERNRFFTWSGRVELLHQDENGLVFGNKSTDDLVKRILQIIKDLLTDATRLENMYGVQRVGPAKQSELSVTPKPILESASELQLPQFVRDFRKIKRTFSSYRSSKIDSFSKHFTWVIIDKEKFNKLIYDLSYYNTRLDELVPGSTPFSTAKGHNGTNLSVTVEVSEDNLNRREAAMAARSDAIRARVLNTLWFRWLDDRRLTVKDAHAQTFSWVLDPDVDTESPNHLPTWLQSGSGIYWLYGKAGSGKSTLMKFLHDDERTQKYLKTWAGDSELISISFFFYALGHPEQKSQLGLLRSLLYQILSHDAALAETALPNVWREASRDNEQKHEDLSMPSVAEMVNALKCICKMYRATKKMFFLIDGIDEYEGNDIDIAGFISELGKFSDVKVLVSSRPHPAFFTSFRESPSMDLPRLTEQDIASYVDDTVASHPYMKDLYAMDPNAAHSITRSLVERASGVFLWVVLVCRSVIEGCDEYETTSDLQARVDESPKEIEDLFNHIFESIPPRWGDEATKIMFLMYKNAFGGGELPIFGLHLICEQGYSSDIHSSDITACGPVTPEEMESKCISMERRLRSRCRGLVEVRRPPKPTYGFDWFGEGDINDSSIRHCYVDYMHRTVFEFLWPKFQRFDPITIQQDFDTSLVLCNLWCQLAATCHEHRSCKKPGNRYKSHLRQDCFYNAIGIFRLANKHKYKPEILLHFISRIQYTCGMFLYEDCPDTTKHFLHDGKCRDYYSDMSVVLALAAEFSLYKTIKLVYESNVPLHHLLYRPLRLKLLERCQTRNTTVVGSLNCRKNEPYREIETKQGVLNIRAPLTFHCALLPYLCELSHSTYFMSNDPDRLQALKFVLEKESLNSLEIKTLLDKFDTLCDKQGEDCSQIYKEMQLLMHSRFG